MKWLVTLTVLCALLAAAQLSSGQNAMREGVATTYEHLATAIIEMRATETNLVHGILMHHHASASTALAAAAEASGAERQKLLESASAEIAALAVEGDKAVQAVRQRLLKAGHHHHTDAETKDDYIFIDGGEKKSLLALAGKVAKLGDDADAIRAVGDELGRLFASATRPE